MQVKKYQSIYTGIEIEQLVLCQVSCDDIDNIINTDQCFSNKIFIKNTQDSYDYLYHIVGGHKYKIGINRNCTSLYRVVPNFDLVHKNRPYVHTLSQGSVVYKCLDPTAIANQYTKALILDLDYRSNL